jgi:hypothetical protein
METAARVAAEWAGGGIGGSGRTRGGRPREVTMAEERSVGRRRHQSRRVGLAGAALATLVLLGLSASSASQLSVTSSRVAVFSATRCTNTTMSVHVDPIGQTSWWQHNKTAVKIFNYPASCNGSSVDITVTNGAGAAIASGTATCNSPTCTISTGSYDASTAAGVSMLAATWGLPSSWDSVCTLSGFLNFYMDCT